MDKELAKQIRDKLCDLYRELYIDHEEVAEIVLDLAILFEKIS